MLFLLGSATMGAHADQGAMYWGSELGVARGNNQIGEFTNSLVRLYGGTATAEQDATSSMTFKIFGGYRYNEHVDVELAYLRSPTTHLNFSGVAANTMPYAGGADVTYSGIEYAVNLRPSFASGWNGLYLRVGGHSSKIESEAALRNTGTSTTSTTYGMGTVYGIGYDHALGDWGKMRYALMQYEKIGGLSSAYGAVYSIGFLKDF